MHLVAHRWALELALGTTGFEPATFCSQMGSQGRLGVHRAQVRSIQISRSHPAGCTLNGVPGVALGKQPLCDPCNQPFFASVPA